MITIHQIGELSATHRVLVHELAHAMGFLASPGVEEVAITWDEDDGGPSAKAMQTYPVKVDQYPDFDYGLTLIAGLFLSGTIGVDASDDLARIKEMGPARLAKTLPAARSIVIDLLEFLSIPMLDEMVDELVKSGGLTIAAPVGSRTIH